MLRWPQAAQKASTSVDPQFRQAAGRGRLSRTEGTGRGLREELEGLGGRRGDEEGGERDRQEGERGHVRL
jgi:hypothetical protein